jgi:uroporphyrin-III C-methyltransferase
MNGKVYLIGAGPGDVELLTLKAVRALSQADVALVDELVNPEVRDFLRPDARVIDVGKRGGCKSTPQSFIERQMVQFARQGLKVARVKGGDPFVFGRGGEEVETLMAAGIEVEVINGITAGIGAPAALGIPVTHRDFSRGVTLVTGHTRNGDAPNWDALVRSGTTLVIYMGISNLAQIVAGLRAAGLAESAPVAVIQNGTLANQRSLVTRLADLVGAVNRAGLGSPAIVVVGEVVRLATVSTDIEAVRQVA